MLLHTLLLRPQDQEIHDYENRDERQELNEHLAAAGSRTLSVGGRNPHGQSPLPGRGKLGPESEKFGPTPQLARNIMGTRLNATHGGSFGGKKTGRRHLAAPVRPR
jgi:hypothetical protein